MSASTLPFFFDESLRAGFVQDLADARQDGRISEQERQWLQLLAAPDVGHQSVLPRPQVFRVMRDDIQDLTPQVTDALLICDAAGAATVYLYTLLDGLERFTDRPALRVALNARLAGAPTTGVFEQERIEGPLFEQYMLAIVRHQAEHLRTLSQHLRKLPSLRQALAQGFKHYLSRLLPDLGVDLSRALVLITQADGSGGEAPVVRTSTLEEQAMQHWVGKVMPAGQQRVFIDSSGRVQSAANARLHQQALSEAVQQIESVYEERLTDYWASLDDTGQSRQTLAAGALAEGFRQELLAARHRGTLTRNEFQRLAGLLRPTGHDVAALPQVQRLSLKIGHQEPLKLAGLLLIDLGPQLLLYSALHGLQRIPSLQSLVTSPEPMALRRYLSLNDQALLGRTDALRIDAYLIERAPFLDMIEAIIGLQKRNLQFALSRARTDEDESAAMLDDALDIRHLLDRGLLHIDGQGRWTEGETLFSRHWLEVMPPTAFDVTLGPIPRSSLSSTWFEKIQTLEDQLERLDRLRPGIESFACQVLNEYLAAFGDTSLTADSIQVRWTQPEPRTAGLVTLLLEKISGYHSAPLPEDAQVSIPATYHDPARDLTSVTPAFLNHVLDAIEPGFLDGYLRFLDELCRRTTRQPFRTFDPGALGRALLEDFLRLEYDVHQRLSKLGLPRFAMFKQVLDLPVRALREHLGDDMTEVYGVTLKYDPRYPAVPMSNIFALARPAQQGVGAVCWSAVTGLSPITSLNALQASLKKRLTHAWSRDPFLELLNEADIPRVRAGLDQGTLSVELQRIDGHFIEALQALEQARRRDKVRHMYHDARRGKLQAADLIRFTRLAESEGRLLAPLNELSILIQRLLLEDVLPAWLKLASLDDVIAYRELLNRYYISNDPQEDFLVGIPDLRGFSRTQLLKRLDTDFPGQPLDPDAITIKLTHYVSGLVGAGDTPSFMPAATVVKTESLTDFALNHFSSFQGAVLTVQLPANVAPALQLTAQYCQTLVRELDVGRQYQALLAQKLDEHTGDYTTRRSRFVAQMPSRMLLSALELTLQGELDPLAYQFVQQVLDMPDGVARQFTGEHDVTLRPLQLLAVDGIAPDSVTGLYLIGPRDTSKGPVVLHAMFNKAFCFKQYADQAALLADLRSSAQLQNLALDRLDPILRRRYDNGGFTEAHIPWSTEGLFDGPFMAPGPVRLAGDPVAGNALHYLFTETLKVLKDMARKQAVTTAQADWQSLVYLMSLGTEQILSFLPGKLGVLMALWQSKELFKASALSAYDWKLGKALSEFSAALGLLIGSRGGGVDEPLEDTAGAVASDDTRRPAKTEFSWQRSLWTADLKARLRTFEVRDIVLNDLQYDPLYNVYRDAQSSRLYAAVEGQVYRVRMDDDQWRVVGEHALGPRLQFDATQHWKLDLEGRLLGGGGVASLLRLPDVPTEISESFIIEAQGMREIRRQYREKYRMIGQAQQQVRTYLENALYNLSPLSADGRPDNRTMEIIADFFGVLSPDAELITSIRDMTTQLHRALTDPSLSVLSSRRFVVGSNKPGHETRAAFVYRTDSRRRIFLTEQFFEVPDYNLDPNHADYDSFNLESHYCGALLLHELTHIVNGTNDIAYLQSSAPFPDLLGSSSPADVRLKTGIEQLRRSSLSQLTPASQLFRTRNLAGTGWRDLTDRDGSGKNRILQITGQTRLEQARMVFFTNPRKRWAIMLANADTVAVLLTLLGRRRFDAQPAAQNAGSSGAS